MKNILVVLIYLLSLSPLFSQGWERFYGDPSDFESGAGIIQAPDNGFVLVYHNAPDAEIKKINSLGEEEWSLSVQKPSGLSHILERADGGFLVSGIADSFGSGDAVIRGYDWDGNIEWQVDEVSVDASQWVALPDGYVSFFMDEPNEVFRWKIDLSGNLLWADTVTISNLIPGGDISSSIDGGFVIGGNTFSGEAILAKYNSDGVSEWTSSTSTSINEAGNGRITSTSDGGFIVTNDLSGPDDTPSINKFSATGEHLWNSVFISPLTTNADYIQEVDEDSEGNIIMSGRYSTTEDIAYLLKYSGSGDFIFFKQLNGSRLNKVRATTNGFYVAAGNSFPNINGGDAYFVLTNYDGQIFPNAIQGKVYFDEDNNCINSASELLLEGWNIKAEGDDIYHDIIDSDGNYFIEIDTGDYTLSITPPNDLWAPCENPLDITVTLEDTLTSDFPVQAAIECPAMQVDISRPFLRRCFENELVVEYCNLGTVVAEDATIDVTLDSLIEYLSSTIPLASQNGNVYTFNLGDVGIMECGTFRINTLVSCDAVLGQTLCFEAHVFPDTICGMPFNWSGASMEARAKCEGDSTIILELENVGTVPTSEALEYIVIEDQIIFLDGEQVFDPLDVWQFDHPANGSTWRVLCEQEPNHPGNQFPTAFVEGCGTNAVGGFSIGFINEHPLADGDPFVDIDCEEVVGAYDPNDKTAQPVGYGPEHFIEPNTDIEYRIRFQNTGTDTAFNVVIRDTLSSLLDPTSLRPGASSHEYEYDLIGNGVAVFSFPNIMLPDSNVNVELSQGFVTFKISQKPDLAPESYITNSAAIYFDFNEPIITNTAFHTIEREFIISAITDPSPLSNVEVKVYPNPFSNQATFEVDGAEGEELTLRLFDGTGRLVRNETFTGNQLLFERQGLRDGIWFFQILAEGQQVGSGKLIITR